MVCASLLSLLCLLNIVVSEFPAKRRQDDSKFVDVSRLCRFGTMVY
jgi:hypothetical protein